MCCRENKRGAGRKSFGQTPGGRPGWLVKAGMSCGGRLGEFSLWRPSQVGEVGPSPGICVWLCSEARVSTKFSRALSGQQVCNAVFREQGPKYSSTLPPLQRGQVEVLPDRNQTNVTEHPPHPKCLPCVHLPPNYPLMPVASCPL